MRQEILERVRVMEKCASEFWCGVTRSVTSWSKKVQENGKKQGKIPGGCLKYLLYLLTSKQVFNYKQDHSTPEIQDMQYLGFPHNFCTNEPLTFEIRTPWSRGGTTHKLSQVLSVTRSLLLQATMQFHSPIVTTLTQYLTDGVPSISTFDEFIKWIEDAFGDLDCSRTAHTKLHDLKMACWQMSIQHDLRFWQEGLVSIRQLWKMHTLEDFLLLSLTRSTNSKHPYTNGY